MELSALQVNNGLWAVGRAPWVHLFSVIYKHQKKSLFSYFPFLTVMKVYFAKNNCPY
jgi:hypothetical protein